MGGPSGMPLNGGLWGQTQQRPVQQGGSVHNSRQLHRHIPCLVQVLKIFELKLDWHLPIEICYVLLLPRSYTKKRHCPLRRSPAKQIRTPSFGDAPSIRQSDRHFSYAESCLNSICSFLLRLERDSRSSISLSHKDWGTSKRMIFNSAGRSNLTKLSKACERLILPKQAWVLHGHNNNFHASIRKSCSSSRRSSSKRSLTDSRSSTS